MLPQPSFEYCAQAISSCNKVLRLIRAQTLHTYMHKCGLDVHKFLGNLLVTMLVNAGNLGDAQTTFDKLANPNNSSYNTLITGYTNCEELHYALGLHQRLQNHALLHLNGQNLVALLKACAKNKDLERGVEIHGEVARLRMEKDVFVGSSLVDMYTKCGSLNKAREVLRKLPARNVVSWNALMAGYAKYGYGEEALDCFDEMQHEGISPDSVSFLCSLKACGISGTVQKGRELHAEIERKSLLHVDAAVGNTLVDMYVKCGSIAFAKQVFSKLPVKNVVTWTNLIAGFAEHGDTETASKCFKQMQVDGICPDAVAVVCGLRACGIKPDDVSDDEEDVEMEKENIERRFSSLNLLHERNISCLLPGNAEHSPEMHLPCSMALQFEEHAEHMLRKGPRKMRFGGMPSNTAATCHSGEVQGSIDVLNGEKDLKIGNTLLDIYCKCGSLRKAQKTFDQLLNRDQVSWNILIAGYSEHGHGGEALKRFEQMRGDGFYPDIVTYVCILKACGTIGALEEGLGIHIEITKKGLLETDLLIGSTLVDMYAKCGSLPMAHQVFDMLPIQNVVSWTSLMAGYTRHGFGEKAIKLFEQMQRKSVSPDVATVVSLLKACTNLGATDKVREIHFEIERRGFLETDLTVGNALVDIYAKCGALSKAQNLFDSLPSHDVVSWNSLIAGYVGHGRSEEALKWFEQMQLEGVSPDAVTYASSLQACSKIGVVHHCEKIQTCLLKRDLCTLADMYTKCSLFAKAQEVLLKFPIEHANALTSACVDHG